MDVEDLKKEEKPLTEEQQKQVNNFLMSLMRQKLKNRLADIRKYLVGRNAMTLAELKEAVSSRKLYLSKSNRDVLLNIDEDKLNELIFGKNDI